MSHRSARFGSLLTSVRESTLRCLGCEGGYQAIILGTSGTGAIESILCAVEGPLLVLETGRYSRRMASMATVHGHTVHSLPVAEFAAVDPEAVEHALIRLPTVRTLAIVHCETTTGHLSPVAELCKVARLHGVATIVDAVGSAGAHRLPVGPEGPDWMAISSGKAVESMPGLSVIVARSETLAAKVTDRPAYFLDARRNWRAQRDGSVAHTVSVPLLCALDDALRRWEVETADGRTRRYAATADALRRELVANDFDLIPLPDAQRSNVVIPVRLPDGVDFERVQIDLADRDIEVYFSPEAQEQGYFFLSLIGDVDRRLIPRFVRVLAHSCSHIGHAPLRHRSTHD